MTLVKPAKACNENYGSGPLGSLQGAMQYQPSLTTWGAIARLNRKMQQERARLINAGVGAESCGSDGSTSRSSLIGMETVFALTLRSSKARSPACSRS